MKTFIIQNSNSVDTSKFFGTLMRPFKKIGFGKHTIIILIMILSIWQGLSLIYSQMILPSPFLTIKSLITIMKEERFLLEIFATLKRLFIGLLGAIIVGIILGFFIGVNRKVKYLLEPLVYIIQSIPPILFMTLAMIWFGLDGQATIFIVFIVNLPIMAINIKEGFENIDTKLIEMGKIFKFSKRKMIFQIIVPSLRTYFKSGLIIVMALGWKIVIMGEVLSSSTGIGAQITDGRLNLETTTVFAWSIIVIVLCFSSQKLVDIAYNLIELKRDNDAA